MLQIPFAAGVSAPKGAKSKISRIPSRVPAASNLLGRLLCEHSPCCRRFFCSPHSLSARSLPAITGAGLRGIALMAAHLTFHCSLLRAVRSQRKNPTRSALLLLRESCG